MENLEMMKKWIKDHGLTDQVREFTQMGSDSDAAIELVYDAHNLDRDDFKMKYFGK